MANGRLVSGTEARVITDQDGITKTRAYEVPSKNSWQDLAKYLVKILTRPACKNHA